MTTSTAVAALALKRVKRAQGQLRAVVGVLAAELDQEADVVGEAHVEPGDERALEQALTLVRLACKRPGPVDVVVLSTPVAERGRTHQPASTPTSAASSGERSRQNGQRST